MVSTKFCLTLWIATIAIVVTIGGAVGVAANGDDEPQVKKVRKVVIQCDDDTGDCDESVELSDLRDHHVWVDEGIHKKIRIIRDNGDSEDNFTVLVDGAHSGGFLGVQLTGLTPELRSHFGVDEDRGVMVSKVVDDSAAFRAGLQAGDIITAVNSEDVSSQRDLIHSIGSRSEGESVDLEIWRDGGSQTISAMLDKRSPTDFGRHEVHLGCDSDDDDCGVRIAHAIHIDSELGCGDEEPCRVEVACHEGECECTVNGEATDCDQIHGFQPPRD